VFRSADILVNTEQTSLATTGLM